MTKDQLANWAYPAGCLRCESCNGDGLAHFYWQNISGIVDARYTYNCELCNSTGFDRRTLIKELANPDFLRIYGVDEKQLEWALDRLGLLKSNICQLNAIIL